MRSVVKEGRKYVESRTGDPTVITKVRVKFGK